MLLFGTLITQPLHKESFVVDQEFKSWVLQRFAELSSGTMGQFLSDLRLRPNVVLQHIIANINLWARAYAKRTGKALIVNVEADSREILEALKVQFASELTETIQQAST